LSIKNVKEGISLAASNMLGMFLTIIFLAGNRISLKTKRMETRNKKTIIGRHPLEKGTEEKGLLLHHRPLSLKLRSFLSLQIHYIKQSKIFFLFHFGEFLPIIVG
jgi:hypothetical protein